MAPTASVSVAGRQVGKLAFGLMQLTTTPTPVPLENAFAVLKAAVDTGCNYWCTAEFYGRADRLANLKLCRAFFEKYPEYKEKVFLAVKGGTGRSDWNPDSSPENLRASVLTCKETLGDKRMDMFMCARQDRRVAIEDQIKTLAALRDEGHFDVIGLSEAKAETIRRAAAVTTIGSVEVEYSLWSTDAREAGVFDACKELGIAIAAYAPLGRGFLTGAIKSRADLPEGDSRLHQPRFSEANFPANLKLVDQIAAIANKKGVTTSQLALAWVLAQPYPLLPVPGTSNPKRLEENAKSLELELSEDELASIDEVLKSTTISGDRYPQALLADLLQ